MPIINRVAEFADDMKVWRRDFHMHPELLYDVHRTAAVVADKLKDFGCDEVVGGIGRTGVVGVIRGRKQSSGRTIGLRADMDALPINEITDLPWRSSVPGRMHACGHDGHTTMLLGAARHLCETRNFDGTAIVIFQPAEEGGGGGKAMLEDGLLQRFPMEEVYGMHNWPGMPVGSFGIRAGPMMAAADRFEITIEGRGAHAAQPMNSVDPVVIGAEIVMALQTIVARNVNPLEACVLSVTTFHAGDTHNVIPQTAKLSGTVRTLRESVRDLVERRMNDIVTGVAKLHGAKAVLDYHHGYPVLENEPGCTEFAVEVAQEVAGGKVDPQLTPTMGAEDFSYMLQQRPGAYIFIGNGDSAGVHHPAYDFNDTVSPFGASYWVRLVEKRLPA